MWEDTEVTFDILRLPSDDAVEDIVELSFKSDDYVSAAEKRQQLTGVSEEPFPICVVRRSNNLYSE